jgi:putative ABC transport system permease protein
MREGALWIVGCVGTGLIGARMLSRHLESLLFRIGPNDLATFVAVTALLAVVALVASAIPAVRATRVDPVVSLRSE